MDGRRILVVGASAGIGRAFAVSAAATGGEVCVSARRHDKLIEVCAEMGGGHAVAGDASTTAGSRALVAEAARLLGGLDLVLYSAGTARLAPLALADEEAWRVSYDVNVVGPAMVCQAALEHLSPDGLIGFLSSEAAHETRWGMGTYAASKAALDTAVRHWRHEHPDRRFSRIIMGATMPTEFGNNFTDADLLTTALERWEQSGIAPTVMETSDVGQHLAELLAVVLAHPEIDVPDLYLDVWGQPWA